MSRIEWEPEHSVANDELDNQHRTLFEHYNRLHEALLNDPPEQLSRARLETLSGLTEYISIHFAAEERYMEEIGFPDLAAHRQMHQTFKEQIETINRDIREGRIVLSSSLLKFLRNWIEDHIRQEDIRYARFVAKQ